MNLLLVAILGALLTGPVGALAEEARPAREAGVCFPIGQLAPEVLGGSLKALPEDSTTARRWRWRVEKGDRLRLRPRTVAAGDHAFFLRALATTENMPLSVEVWGIALQHHDQTRFLLPTAVKGDAQDLRLDPFPLSPGAHVLELESHGKGELLLECIGAQRTGPRSGDTRWPDPEVEVDERPFLGVQLASGGEDGVGVDRVYTGTAAEKIGLAAGDVIVRIDGKPTRTTQSLIAAIQAWPPDTPVDVEWLRDGERFLKKAKLGRRLDEHEMRADQAAEVLEILAAQPGQTVADIGCGSGWLSLAIAARVGEKGTVYALEIQEEHVLQMLRRNLAQVIPVLSESDDVALPEDSLDIAVLHDVASHIDRDARAAFYDSLIRALKSRGRLVVFGPHGEAETMLRVLDEHGFVPQAAASLDGLTEEELDSRLGEGISFVPRATRPR